MSAVAQGQQTSTQRCEAVVLLLLSWTVVKETVIYLEWRGRRQIRHVGLPGQTPVHLRWAEQPTKELLRILLAGRLVLRIQISSNRRSLLQHVTLESDRAKDTDLLRPE